MQFGQGWDEAHPDQAPVDLDATIAEIRRHEADVVFLQEVEQAQTGGRQVEPPPNYTRLCAALPGYDSCFSYPRADPRELPFGLGLAIFSRTPLRDTFREDLPSPPISFDFFGEAKTPTDRVLIGARTVVEGREITLLNTHLLAFFMLKTSGARYPQQRERVAELLRAQNGPTLLAGDFNASNHAALIAQFGACGFSTAQQTEITWRRRPYVLDHIFFNAGLQCTDCRVEPTPTSDHHALVADFILAEQGAETVAPSSAQTAA